MKIVLKLDLELDGYSQFPQNSSTLEAIKVSSLEMEVVKLLTKLWSVLLYVAIMTVANGYGWQWLQQSPLSSAAVTAMLLHWNNLLKPLLKPQSAEMLSMLKIYVDGQLLNKQLG